MLIYISFKQAGESLVVLPPLSRGLKVLPKKIKKYVVVVVVVRGCVKWL